MRTIRQGGGAGIAGSLTGCPSTRTAPAAKNPRMRSSLIPAAIIRSSTVTVALSCMTGTLSTPTPSERYGARGVVAARAYASPPARSRPLRTGVGAGGGG